MCGISLSDLYFPIIRISEDMWHLTALPLSGMEILKPPELFLKITYVVLVVYFKSQLATHVIVDLMKIMPISS